MTLLANQKSYSLLQSSFDVRLTRDCGWWRERAFAPHVRWLTNKFAWYGTAQRFDCLTLTFRENADGSFVAHHYRYAPEMSTFIVECDAGTWRRAGFERMSDAESRAYCERVFAAADRLRREVNGDEVSYVVTRNIQYTNVCYFRCGFCAFSKGKLAANLRGPAYLVPHEEIVRRVVEAWERGATEICLQGGIHPAFTGDYYAEVVRSIKQAVPGIHVHAFSALEVWQGAATLGLDLAVCYSVIKNHDGLINVESEAGKGTTFHIYLPAAG